MEKTMMKADHQPAIFSTTTNARNVVILGCVLRIAGAEEESWSQCGCNLTRSAGAAKYSRIAIYAR